MSGIDPLAELDSTCEQCGKDYPHHLTTAFARFDFCSRECEDLWYSMHNQPTLGEIPVQA